MAREYAPSREKGIPNLKRTKRFNERDFMKITREQPEEATVLEGSRGEQLVPGETTRRLTQRLRLLLGKWFV